VATELPTAVWRGGAAFLVLICGVATYLAERLGSQFYADDFLYLQLARDAKVDLHWFTIDNYGHFAPLTRLAYLVVQRWFGLNYLASAVVPALLASSIVMAVLWICRSALGRRASVLVCGLFVAQSMVMLRIAMWWGASVHVMGSAAAYLFCLAGFVEYLRSKRRRFQVGSLVALILALLVQERPLIVLGYLVLIRYLLRYRLPEGERVLRAVRRDVWLWVPYIAVTGTYLVYRLLFFSSSPTPANVHNALLFFENGLGRSYLPALVGARSDRYGPLINHATFLGLAGISAALFVYSRFRPGWWRVAAFAAIGYLVNIGLVAAGRNVGDAVAASLDLQYFLDPYLLVPIAFAIAVSACPASSQRKASWPSGLSVALCIALVGVLVSNGLTWRAMVRANNQTAAHFYVDRALDGLHDMNGSYDLLRMNVSLDVAPAFIAPYNQQTGIFTLDDGVRRRVDPTAATKVGLLSTGQLVPLAVSTQSQFSALSANPTAGNGAVVSLQRGEACISGPAGSYLSLQLPESLYGSDLFYGLRYSTSASENVRLLTVVPSGPVVYNGARTPVRAGSGLSRFDRLEGTEIHLLWLLFEEGVHNFCVSDVWIGNVAYDQGSAGCSVLTYYGTELRREPRCSAFPFVDR
jgi:hypothetical protein